MGSPVSAIIANLYIEFFEELALNSAPCRPRLWKRYVNDTCCILKKDAVDGLLHHLNGVRPTIKFTMELEKNGSLPFLDANLTQKEDGTLNISVFRKQICTDRYLQFNSHHPEGSCQEPFQQSQEHHTTEGGPAEGRRPPHHYFQAEWLLFTIHLFHLLHSETIYTTRRPG